MITLRSSVRTTANRRGVPSAGPADEPPRRRLRGRAGRRPPETVATAGPGGSEAAEDRCDDDDDEADVVGRRRGRTGGYRRNRALPAGVEKARSERSGLGGDRSQEIHRLFGGEYSGSGCYIVVTAGREDSRGLGNPMTEPFPRRPRVLGSPRSVALAKEGVPPEWEPGCGAPRRRRPVGRERQPGATGHVTSGPGHRTRCGGEPRTFGRALAAGRDRPVGMEERPSRMRRRVPPVTWEPLTSPRPRTCTGASSGTAPSAHQPERIPRAVRVRLNAHRPVAVESVPAYAEADPSDSPHV